MSDKDRAKKDHERTDKKNSAMREDVAQRSQQAQPRREDKEESTMTHLHPGKDSPRKQH